MCQQAVNSHLVKVNDRRFELQIASALEIHDDIFSCFRFSLDFSWIPPNLLILTVYLSRKQTTVPQIIFLPRRA